MVTEQKFRIKVVERNDRTVIYHPQIWICTGCFFTWFRKLKYTHGWVDFIQMETRINTCNKENEIGINFPIIEDAYAFIEKYKKEYTSRIEQTQEDYKKMEEERHKNFLLETKEVTFIEIN